MDWNEEHEEYTARQRLESVEGTEETQHQPQLCYPGSMEETRMSSSLVGPLGWPFFEERPQSAYAWLDKFRQGPKTMRLPELMTDDSPGSSKRSSNDSIMTFVAEQQSSGEGTTLHSLVTPRVGASHRPDQCCVSCGRLFHESSHLNQHYSEYHGKDHPSLVDGYMTGHARTGHQAAMYSADQARLDLPENDSDHLKSVRAASIEPVIKTEESNLRNKNEASSGRLTQCGYYSAESGSSETDSLDTMNVSPEEHDIHYTSDIKCRKEQIIDRLMVCVHGMFTSSGSGTPHEHACNSSSDSHTQSGPSSLEHPKRSEKKRKAGERGEDSDHHSDGDRSRKRQKLQQRSDGPKQESSKKLACPYFKHDPRKRHTSGACCGPGWDTVHRIKYGHFISASWLIR